MTLHLVYSRFHLLPFRTSIFYFTHEPQPCISINEGIAVCAHGSCVCIILAYCRYRGTANVMPHVASLECIRPLKIQDPKPVHAKLIEHRASSYYEFVLVSYGNRWWALHSQARAALQSPCLRVVSRRRAVLDGRRGPSAKSRLDKCKNNRPKKSCAGQLAMRYCEKILDLFSLTTRML